MSNATSVTAEDLLKALGESKEPMPSRDLREELGVTAEDAPAFRATLLALVNDGRVEKIESSDGTQPRYALASKATRKKVDADPAPKPAATGKRRGPTAQGNLARSIAVAMPPHGRFRVRARVHQRPAAPAVRRRAG